MKPKVIGITGGFGTGKSTVAEIFHELGAVVLDADEIVSEMMKPTGELYKSYLGLYGSAILKKGTDEIDRAKVAEIVFNDEGKLQLLNSVVHPVVVDKIKAELDKPDATEDAIYCIDAPLLLEARLEELIDKLVVVTATEKNQIDRCKKKLKMPAKEIKKRIANQLPLEEKKKQADFIIDNKGTVNKTKEQAKDVWRKIKKWDRT